MAFDKPSEYLKLPFYQQLKYFSYLKGFLKPFKGKGDWEDLVQQTSETRSALATAIREINELLKQPPWSLLKVMLRVQSSKQYGTTFLRWATRDFGAMGIDVWEGLMLDPKTPESLVEELHAMEQMRIAINMQLSAANTLLRMARECVDKSAYAEQVLSRRLAGERLAVNTSALKTLPVSERHRRKHVKNRLY